MGCSHRMQSIATTLAQLPRHRYHLTMLRAPRTKPANPSSPPRAAGCNAYAGCSRLTSVTAHTVVEPFVSSLRSPTRRSSPGSSRIATQAMVLPLRRMLASLVHHPRLRRSRPHLTSDCGVCQVSRCAGLARQHKGQVGLEPINMSECWSSDSQPPMMCLFSSHYYAPSTLIGRHSKRPNRFRDTMLAPLNFLSASEAAGWCNIQASALPGPA